MGGGIEKDTVFSTFLCPFFLRFLLSFFLRFLVVFSTFFREANVEKTFVQKTQEKRSERFLHPYHVLTHMLRGIRGYDAPSV